MKDPEKRILRGDVCLDKGDIAKAVEEYSAAVLIDPERALAYRKRGDAWFAAGEYDRAAEDYKTAIAKATPCEVKLSGCEELTARDSVGKACAMCREGDLKDALPVFDRALKFNPDNADAWLYRGFTLSKLGRAKAAIADLTRAVNLCPRWGKAYAYRGNAYKEAGRNALARADYDRALKADPGYALAYYDRGLLDAAEGKRAAALENFRMYVSMPPAKDKEDDMTAWAYYSMACLFALDGKKIEALSDLETALEKGLRDRAWIEADADLAGLRGDPAYAALMEKYFGGKI